ncbi:MAG: DUF5060 domain-containing protein [Phycisphaerales bacterium]|nr:DUF5060 domain-containing protein [Phycisphaerales bacterium]
MALGYTARLKAAADPRRPITSPRVTFEEKDGVVVVEAEHFYKQTLNKVRSWFIFTPNQQPKLNPDGDPPHLKDASGGAYVEILPDTRRTHADKLITGKNFSNTPGKMAVLYYRVYFNTPGKYYVWARIFSTNGEDNGLHVGIDGTWPASGQRMQWIGKNKWVWGSKQRTDKKHTGEPYKLFLNVKKPGLHAIMFSMREDGTEFDKWMMVKEKKTAVKGHGPASRVKMGKAPKPFAASTKATADKTKKAPDGDGGVTVSGELKQWHKVTITQNGPFANEMDKTPNPFMDYRMTVTFKHESGSPKYAVPGYFAADGNSANTSAESGVKWRAHLSPDKTGKWSYRVSFVKGKQAAASDIAGAPVAGCDGKSGTFTIKPSDKTGRDLRARGRLQYVGKHHLRFAGSGEYFLKCGADAPENFLAYKDFDGPFKSDGHKDNLIKTWTPHVKDWRAGDPTWQKNKGKGIIGAINYLASEGMNAFSFLPMNIAGDDRNVFPYTSYNEREHLDCSRMDQWAIVLEHGSNMGMYLHFKTQETENELLLDKGNLGPHRKLYYRELIARFAHNLALNWNLGEEINNASHKQKVDWANYFHTTDPYQHNIVIHNMGNPHYDLLGKASALTGFSLQTNRSDFHQVHSRTLDYITRSAKAGKPWVVACDEPGDPTHALRPDNDAGASHTDGRKNALWGNIMAGGAGLEFYFGYKHAHSDLTCQSYRSRDKFWDYCRYALEFFKDNKIPFWEMTNANTLIESGKKNNRTYCLARPGEIYLAYFTNGGAAKLDLGKARGKFTVQWFNPRKGGKLQNGSLRQITGGAKADIGKPPSDPNQDWLAVIRRETK